VEDSQNSSKKIGHQSYLTIIDEMALVEWCFTMQKVALCVTLNMLKCTIQTIMKNALRTHPFRKWNTMAQVVGWVQKRHHDISLRCANNLEMKIALILK
jgi:hypothetical protein